MFGKFFGRKTSHRNHGESPSGSGGAGRGEPFVTRDTRTAIEELSHVVKDNPEAVEIYLALGSLYRAQGEIERAIQIRNNLIHRHGLEPKFKARVLLELGRDFRRGGFLDRSAQALNEARQLAGDNREIILEQAELAAQSSEFELAAEHYGELQLPMNQAHYLVRLAKDKFFQNDASTGHKYLKKALKVYAASPEAWLERCIQAFRAGSQSKLGSSVKNALKELGPRMRFIILDELITAAMQLPDEERREQGLRLLCEAVVPVVRELEPDVLSYYYGARMLLLCGDSEEANVWLEKTLMMRPNFWLARLELLDFSRERQAISSFFMEQLDFFVDQARRVRRFHCTSCGLKRDSVFFVCPRCRSWHSIAFRTELG